MGSETKRSENASGNDANPSVSISVFLCWVLPIMLLAGLSRFAVDTAPLPPRSPQSIPIDLAKDETNSPSSKPATQAKPTARKTSEPSGMPTILSKKPSSYIEAVQAIERRRLNWVDFSNDPVDGYLVSTSPDPVSASRRSGEENTDSSSEGQYRETSTPPRGASEDPERMRYIQQIDSLRQKLKDHPDDLSNAFSLAEALRMYDVQYHDGGTVQEEAIQTFHKAIELASIKRQTMINQGLETKPANGAAIDPIYGEMDSDWNSRSIDGTLCGLHTSLGKAYFMANMFEKAVESYSAALDINPMYLDAVSSRGSSYIILGDYSKAATDMATVIEKDVSRRFLDVFTGLARVLQAKEDALPEGWTPMISILEDLILVLESQLDAVATGRNEASVLLQSLNRLYHVIFVYHDVKTKKVDLAWEALSKSYAFKMEAMEPWNTGFELQKVSTTKSIFHRGFFPDGVGSIAKTPIFIIGFVRSGSTLLERVLDSHPSIVGTGENSVFNGQLDHIRNRIVEASLVDSGNLSSTIEELADAVVSEMRSRWKMVADEEDRAAGRDQPKRLVDKMLTNYYNVGFIHMLFPDALILHVARDPMDTLLSAYKHEFPPGSLDYTSEFSSLAELYHSYRDLMEHWDKELPGRVTHIRYEDMVHDMPGISKKIIEATGLEWDDSVLDFHKKKHAVNTLSTTQVRKGVYKDSLQAWRRYEHHLKPLMDLVKDEVNYDLRTTVPGYSPVAIEVDESNSIGEL